MILFYDTETTGFYQYRLPVDDPNQPYLVQLAMQLCDDDGSIVSQVSVIVDCPVPIPAKASEVHGIDNAKASGLGVKPETAAGLFQFFASRAQFHVAHNIKFDTAIMRTACVRAGHDNQLQVPELCTMEAATPIVDMPPTERMIAAGFNKPKPPKLEECIKHFFDEDLEGAHDALVDVTACRRVFFHLKSLENI
jgi:DNA polymerase-3 subunit epsilon